MHDPFNDKIDFGDELDRLIRADPFRPFAIVMTSGARYVVGGPDQCAIYYMAYGVYPREGPSAIFPFNQISSVELLEVDA